jgi:hypothetical protein
MKIVINTCFGGFGLSDEATWLYAKLAGINLVEVQSKYCGTEFYIDNVSDETYFSYHDIDRDDGFLIEAVETLGADAASGKYAKLKVVEIPDDVEWNLYEYDGSEHIAEKHRRWS